MREEQIDVRRFTKEELCITLERLLLGFYTSSMNEAADTFEKEEIAINYLAIKEIIRKSDAK